MTADDESTKTKLGAFDYQRDLEEASEEAAPERITPLAKQYVRKSVLWMYVWAVMIGIMSSITLFQSLLNIWQSNGEFTIVILIVAPVIIFGLPLALLVGAANAFTSFDRQENLPDLARGLRCQFWLSVTPFIAMLLLVLLGVIVIVVGMMTGVYYSV